jgi:hypothetical protein
VRLVCKAVEDLQTGDVVGAETFHYEDEIQLWPKARQFRSYVKNPDGPGFLVQWEREGGTFLYANFQQFVVIES